MTGLIQYDPVHYNGEIRSSGLRRPLGAQNEGFFQAHWTKYRSDCNARGYLNNYPGVWLSTFRLSSILDLKSSRIRYAVQFLGNE